MSEKVTGTRNTIIKIFTLDISQKEKLMEKVFTLGRMVSIMKVNGTWVRNMDSENGREMGARLI